MNKLKPVLINEVSSDRTIIRYPVSFTPSNSFFIRQSYWLGFTALLLLWLSWDGRLDIWFTAPWFDMETGHFPLEDNLWLERINHQGSKFFIIALAVIATCRGIYTRNRRLLLVVFLMGCGALVVSLLKTQSAHSCPWSLAQYGGTAQEFLLFAPAPENAGPGRCFPGGHASAGFALMAWFFWFYPERPRLAYCLWGMGIAAGLLLGYGQVVRGAHFMSHNLWAGWWVWLVQLLIFWFVSKVRYIRLYRTAIAS